MRQAHLTCHPRPGKGGGQHCQHAEGSADGSEESGAHLEHAHRLSCSLACGYRGLAEGDGPRSGFGKEGRANWLPRGRSRSAVTAALL